LPCPKRTRRPWASSSNRCKEPLRSPATALVGTAEGSQAFSKRGLWQSKGVRESHLTAPGRAPLEGGARRLSRTGHIIVALVVTTALGCRTREDAAHKMGRESALVAAESCADAAARETCHESNCHDRCASFSDSTHLAETCLAKCMGRGTCNSDLDCDPWRACVMIAPRLRRCERRTDARLHDGDGD
jgi:hypothetical protein